MSRCTITYWMKTKNK